LKATGALHLKSSNLFPGVVPLLIRKKGIDNLVCFQIFQICANRIAISGNEIIARMPPYPLMFPDRI
jgi:hypothetical protein